LSGGSGGSVLFPPGNLFGLKATLFRFYLREQSAKTRDDLLLAWFLCHDRRSAGRLCPHLLGRVSLRLFRRSTLALKALPLTQRSFLLNRRLASGFLSFTRLGLRNRFLFVLGGTFGFRGGGAFGHLGGKTLADPINIGVLESRGMILDWDLHLKESLKEFLGTHPKFLG
jgi:hypothetical protein